MHCEYCTLAAIIDGGTTGRYSGLACGGSPLSRAPQGDRTSSKALFGWKFGTGAKAAAPVAGSTCASGHMGKPLVRAQATKSCQIRLALVPAVGPPELAGGLAEQPVSMATTTAAVTM